MCIYNKSILDVCAGSSELSLVACAISTSSADISTFTMYSYLMGLQTLYHACIYIKSILDVCAGSPELSLVASTISTSSANISTLTCTAALRDYMCAFKIRPYSMFAQARLSFLWLTCAIRTSSADISTFNMYS